MISNIRGKFKYILELYSYYINWIEILFNRVINNTTKLVKMRNGLNISGGNESAIVDLCSEIFVNEFYNPKNMSIRKGDVVVDIGANIGVFGLYASKKLASIIYEVEPVFKNTKLIKNNFIKNKFSNFVVVNVAVTNKNGHQKLYTVDLDSHGLLFDHNVNGRLTNYQTVSTMTLKSIFNKYQIKKVDFLKIDCEGSEGTIIKSLDYKTSQLINRISIEYHDNVSILNHRDILDILKKYKFRVSKLEIDRHFGYLYAWKD